MKPEQNDGDRRGGSKFACTGDVWQYFNRRESEAETTWKLSEPQKVNINTRWMLKLCLCI